MKKILLSAIIMIAASFLNSVSAQKIPQNITTAFSTKYPNAKVDKWRIFNDNYIVEFFSNTKNDKKSFAYYDIHGNWIKTETKIRWTWRLPLDMQTAFNKSGYRAWFIEEIKKVDGPGQDEYLFTVDNRDMLDGDHMDVFFKEFKLYFKDDTLIKKEMID